MNKESKHNTACSFTCHDVTRTNLVTLNNPDFYVDVHIKYAGKYAIPFFVHYCDGNFSLPVQLPAVLAMHALTA